MIVGLILFSQVLTLTIAAASTAATEMKDMELEDKEIKQELEPSETEEIVEEEEEDNTAKQEEEQERNDDDTAGTGLEEDIMIDDNYSYNDDDVPLELPFDNPMPFP
jgi:hypothetical protein